MKGKKGGRSETWRREAETLNSQAARVEGGSLGQVWPNALKAPHHHKLKGKAGTQTSPNAYERLLCLGNRRPQCGQQHLIFICSHYMCSAG
jgi:hypothetical protein